MYNKHKSLAANTAAIETAFRLLREHKQPTPEDSEILNRFSGFGGIKDVLYIGTNVPVAPEFKVFDDTLRDISAGNQTVYNGLLNSVKASVLTAFYTPPFIVRAIAEQIRNACSAYGVKMDSFLEPSAGVGGFLPVALPGTDKYAFEKDEITGAILRCLKGDNVHVNVCGFECFNEKYDEGVRFDCIATNIPFGNIRVFDLDFKRKGGDYAKCMGAVHNYFIFKSLDLLNDGGLLIFIAPRGVADAEGNEYVRKHLVASADMITALRLPDNLFMQTSGVEVGSDLFIFRKNKRKDGLTKRDQEFVDIRQETDGVSCNVLLSQNENALFTEASLKKNQYGKKVWRYVWKDSENDMYERLSTVIHDGFVSAYGVAIPQRSENVEGKRWMFFFNLDKGKQERDMQVDVLPWMKCGTLVLCHGEYGYLGRDLKFKPLTNVEGVALEKLCDYFRVREDYYALSIKESETHTEYPELRAKLNQDYDDFTKKWGHFNMKENKQTLMLDVHGMEVCSIELESNNQIMKSDIMFEPVAFKKGGTSECLSPEEALAACLNIHGTVKMEYLSRATAMSEDEVIDALRGELFFNPVTKKWEDKGRFLSGNVVCKLHEVNAALPLMEGKEKLWADSAAKALGQVVPELIPYEELDFNMGERWIPTRIYEDFAKELFNAPAKITYIDINDTYTVNLLSWSAVAYTVYTVSNLTGCDLFSHALHDTIPEIKKDAYVDGKKVRVTDEEATQSALMKVHEIRSKFNVWLDSRPASVRDELVKLYNERFNCYVRPSYDGALQTFPGLSFEQFPFDGLYPSQKDAVWMIKQNGGGVCWHEVGAGKTMVMCVAAYEMKRIGLVNKPLIIGLKANVHEIADCFRKAYPHARLLYPGKSDFTPSNRKELFSKIKNNNWDCIILTHEQFAKIPQSDETMLGLFEQELDDVERCLEALYDSGVAYRNKKLRRGLEIRQQNLRGKLSGLRHSIEEKKDEHIDFHTMGIDHIFVDECHFFKNLMFQTRHTRVAGIGNSTGSQRAMNLLTAIRDIQKRTGRDLGATFLSGTVVVNALTELYVLFKYLRPRELERQHVYCFDAWAAVFTKKAYDYELSVTGQIRRNERFRTYIKVPELASFLREITDYRTADMINLDIPKKNIRFLSEKPTSEQEDMAIRLMKFAKSGKWEDLGLGVLPPANIDRAKMLIATNVARKMALDMRLLGEQFHDDPLSKASRCADVIYEYYVRYNENKGTQFVFSDLATYKPNEWNIYSDIKEKLIRKGIPADEIRFIQTATTENARKELFREMNEGNVRVLFGSTSMLGTGVNAQQRAVAVHHLEVPWRPADMEQRNGRAVRKGNTVKLWGNNTVDVVIYGTEKTLDAYKFNLLKNKQMFINQINNGTIASRRIDEDSMDENNGMNFAEFVAVLSGNTDLLDKTKLDAKILQLEKEQGIFNKERFRAERKIASNKSDIERHSNNIKKMEQDAEYCSAFTEHNNIVCIKGKDTPESVGRELHRLSRMEGAETLNPVATFIGLNIVMREMRGDDGEFLRNVFFIEGRSGLKYRCGQSGALPSSFVEAAEFPQCAVNAIPEHINRMKETIAELESEIPALEMVRESKWTKTEELESLRRERDELQRKIDNSLKPVSPPVEAA